MLTVGKPEFMTAETRKDKKRKILERNKRNQKIFWSMELLRGAAEGAAAPVFESPRDIEAETRKREEENPVWSAKTQEIRNRLTAGKRQAAERWNRFAGTEGGGARGM